MKRYLIKSLSLLLVLLLGGEPAALMTARGPRFLAPTAQFFNVTPHQPDLQLTRFLENQNLRSDAEWFFIRVKSKRKGATKKPSRSDAKFLPLLRGLWEKGYFHQDHFLMEDPSLSAEEQRVWITNMLFYKSWTLSEKNYFSNLVEYWKTIYEKSSPELILEEMVKEASRMEKEIDQWMEESWRLIREGKYPVEEIEEIKEFKNLPAHTSARIQVFFNLIEAISKKLEIHSSDVSSKEGKPIKNSETPKFNYTEVAPVEVLLESVVNDVSAFESDEDLILKHELFLHIKQLLLALSWAGSISKRDLKKYGIRVKKLGLDPSIFKNNKIKNAFKNKKHDLYARALLSLLLKSNKYKSLLSENVDLLYQELEAQLIEEFDQDAQKAVEILLFWKLAHLDTGADIELPMLQEILVQNRLLMEDHPFVSDSYSIFHQPGIKFKDPDTMKKVYHFAYFLSIDHEVPFMDKLGYENLWDRSLWGVSARSDKKNNPFGINFEDALPGLIALTIDSPEALSIGTEFGDAEWIRYHREAYELSKKEFSEAAVKKLIDKVNAKLSFSDDPLMKARILTYLAGISGFKNRNIYIKSVPAYLKRAYLQVVFLSDEVPVKSIGQDELILSQASGENYLKYLTIYLGCYKDIPLSELLDERLSLKILSGLSKSFHSRNEDARIGDTIQNTLRSRKSSELESFYEDKKKSALERASGFDTGKGSGELFRIISALDGVQVLTDLVQKSDSRKYKRDSYDRLKVIARDYVKPFRKKPFDFIKVEEYLKELSGTPEEKFNLVFEYVYRKVNELSLSRDKIYYQSLNESEKLILRVFKTASVRKDISFYNYFLEQLIAEAVMWAIPDLNAVFIETDWRKSLESKKSTMKDDLLRDKLKKMYREYFNWRKDNLTTDMITERKKAQELKRNYKISEETESSDIYAPNYIKIEVIVRVFKLITGMLQKKRGKYSILTRESILKGETAIAEGFELAHLKDLKDINDTISGNDSIQSIASYRGRAINETHVAQIKKVYTGFSERSGLLDPGIASLFAYFEHVFGIQNDIEREVLAEILLSDTEGVILSEEDENKEYFVQSLEDMPIGEVAQYLERLKKYHESLGVSSYSSKLNHFSNNKLLVNMFAQIGADKKQNGSRQLIDYLTEYLRDEKVCFEIMQNAYNAVLERNKNLDKTPAAEFQQELYILQYSLEGLKRYEERLQERDDIIEKSKFAGFAEMIGGMEPELWIDRFAAVVGSLEQMWTPLTDTFSWETWRYLFDGDDTDGKKVISQALDLISKDLRWKPLTDTLPKNLNPEQMYRIKDQIDCVLRVIARIKKWHESAQGIPGSGEYPFMKNIEAMGLLAERTSLYNLVNNFRIKVDGKIKTHIKDYEQEAETNNLFLQNTAKLFEYLKDHFNGDEGELDEFRKNVVEFQKYYEKGKKHETDEAIFLASAKIQSEFWRLMLDSLRNRREEDLLTQYVEESGLEPLLIEWLVHLKLIYEKDLTHYRFNEEEREVLFDVLYRVWLVQVELYEHYKIINNIPHNQAEIEYRSLMPVLYPRFQDTRKTIKSIIIDKWGDPNQNKNKQMEKLEIDLFEMAVIDRFKSGLANLIPYLETFSTNTKQFRLLLTQLLGNDLELAKIILEKIYKIPQIKKKRRRPGRGNPGKRGPTGQRKKNNIKDLERLMSSALNHIDGLLKMFDEGEFDENSDEFKLIMELGKSYFTAVFSNNEELALRTLRKKQLRAERTRLDTMAHYYHSLYSYFMKLHTRVYTSLAVGQNARTYQKVAIEKMIEQDLILLADQMGLGKTRESLLGMIESNHVSMDEKKILILTPNSVISQWESKIKLLFKPDIYKRRVVVVRKAKDMKKITRHTRFVIMNYENISDSKYRNKFMPEASLRGDAGEKWIPTGIVFDEAHLARKPQKKEGPRQKNLSARLPYRYTEGIDDPDLDNILKENEKKKTYIVTSKLSIEDWVEKLVERYGEEVRDKIFIYDRIINNDRKEERLELVREAVRDQYEYVLFTDDAFKRLFNKTGKQESFDTLFIDRVLEVNEKGKLVVEYKPSVVIWDREGAKKNRAMAAQQLSLALPEAKKYALTGTPAVNAKVHELWALLKFLCPKNKTEKPPKEIMVEDGILVGVPDKKQFNKRYDGELGRRDLNDHLSQFMIRRTTEEVLADELPDIFHRDPVYVDLGPDHFRIYQAKLTELMGGKKTGLELYNPLRKYATHPGIKTEHDPGKPLPAGMIPSKLEKVLEIVQERRKRGEKVLIFSFHKGTIKEMNRLLIEAKKEDIINEALEKKGLNPDAARITLLEEEKRAILNEYLDRYGEKLDELYERDEIAGRKSLTAKRRGKDIKIAQHKKEDNFGVELLSSDEKDEDMRYLRAINFRFNEMADVITSTLGVGGTGIDLQGIEPRTVIFLEFPWIPAERKQAIHRVYRMLQEGDVEVIQLIARGTVDQRFYNMLRDKGKINTEMVDGVVVSDDDDTASTKLMNEIREENQRKRNRPILNDLENKLIEPGSLSDRAQALLQYMQEQIEQFDFFQIYTPLLEAGASLSEAKQNDIKKLIAKKKITVKISSSLKGWDNPIRYYNTFYFSREMIESLAKKYSEEESAENEKILYLLKGYVFSLFMMEDFPPDYNKILFFTDIQYYSNLSYVWNNREFNDYWLAFFEKEYSEDEKWFNSALNKSLILANKLRELEGNSFHQKVIEISDELVELEKVIYEDIRSKYSLDDNDIVENMRHVFMTDVSAAVDGAFELIAKHQYYNHELSHKDKRDILDWFYRYHSLERTQSFEMGRNDIKSPDRLALNKLTEALFVLSDLVRDDLSDQHINEAFDSFAGLNKDQINQLKHLSDVKDKVKLLESILFSIRTVYRPLNDGEYSESDGEKERWVLWKEKIESLLDKIPHINVRDTGLTREEDLAVFYRNLIAEIHDLMTHYVGLEETQKAVDYLLIKYDREMAWDQNVYFDIALSQALIPDNHLGRYVQRGYAKTEKLSSTAEILRLIEERKNTDYKIKELVFHLDFRTLGRVGSTQWYNHKIDNHQQRLNTMIAQQSHEERLMRLGEMPEHGLNGIDLFTKGGKELLMKLKREGIKITAITPREDKAHINQLLQSMGIDTLTDIELVSVETGNDGKKITLNHFAKALKSHFSKRPQDGEEGYTLYLDKDIKTSQFMANQFYDAKVRSFHWEGSDPYPAYDECEKLAEKALEAGGEKSFLLAQEYWINQLDAASLFTDHSKKIRAYSEMGEKIKKYAASEDPDKDLAGRPVKDVTQLLFTYLVYVSEHFYQLQPKQADIDKLDKFIGLMMKNNLTGPAEELEKKAKGKVIKDTAEIFKNFIKYYENYFEKDKYPVDIETKKAIFVALVKSIRGREASRLLQEELETKGEESLKNIAPYLELYVKYVIQPNFEEIYEGIPEESYESVQGIYSKEEESLLEQYFSFFTVNPKRFQEFFTEGLLRMTEAVPENRRRDQYYGFTITEQNAYLFLEPVLSWIEREKPENIILLDTGARPFEKLIRVFVQKYSPETKIHLVPLSVHTAYDTKTSLIEVFNKAKRYYENPFGSEFVKMTEKEKEDFNRLKKLFPLKGKVTILDDNVITGRTVDLSVELLSALGVEGEIQFLTPFASNEKAIQKCAVVTTGLNIPLRAVKESWQSTRSLIHNVPVWESNRYLVGVQKRKPGEIFPEPSREPRSERKAEERRRAKRKFDRALLERFVSDLSRYYKKKKASRLPRFHRETEEKEEGSKTVEIRKPAGTEWDPIEFTIGTKMSPMDTVKLNQELMTLWSEITSLFGNETTAVSEFGSELSLIVPEEVMEKIANFEISARFFEGTKEALERMIDAKFEYSKNKMTLPKQSIRVESIQNFKDSLPTLKIYLEQLQSIVKDERKSMGEVLEAYYDLRKTIDGLTYEEYLRVARIKDEQAYIQIKESARRFIDEELEAIVKDLQREDPYVQMLKKILSLEKDWKNKELIQVVVFPNNKPPKDGEIIDLKENPDGDMWNYEGYHEWIIKEDNGKVLGKIQWVEAVGVHQGMKKKVFLIEDFHVEKQVQVRTADLFHKMLDTLTEVLPERGFDMILAAGRDRYFSYDKEIRKIFDTHIQFRRKYYGTDLDLIEVDNKTDYLDKLTKAKTLLSKVNESLPEETILEIAVRLFKLGVFRNNEGMDTIQGIKAKIENEKELSKLIIQIQTEYESLYHEVDKRLRDLQKGKVESKEFYKTHLKEKQLFHLKHTYTKEWIRLLNLRFRTFKLGQYRILWNRPTEEQARKAEPNLKLIEFLEETGIVPETKRLKLRGIKDHLAEGLGLKEDASRFLTYWAKRWYYLSTEKAELGQMKQRWIHYRGKESYEDHLIQLAKKILKAKGERTEEDLQKFLSLQLHRAMKRASEKGQQLLYLADARDKEKDALWPGSKRTRKRYRLFELEDSKGVNRMLFMDSSVNFNSIKKQLQSVGIDQLFFPGEEILLVPIKDFKFMVYKRFGSDDWKRVPFVRIGLDPDIYRNFVDQCAELDRNFYTGVKNRDGNKRGIRRKKVNFRFMKAFFDETDSSEGLQDVIASVLKTGEVDPAEEIAEVPFEEITTSEPVRVGEGAQGKVDEVVVEFEDQSHKMVRKEGKTVQRKETLFSRDVLIPAMEGKELEHIRKVYKAGIREGIPYELLEHIDGKNVAEFVRDFARKDNSYLKKDSLVLGVHIIEQVVEGLFELMSLGFGGHPSIKPANVMVRTDEDGFIEGKLIDLGSLSRMFAPLSQRSEILTYPNLKKFFEQFPESTQDLLGIGSVDTTEIAPEVPATERFVPLLSEKELWGDVKDRKGRASEIYQKIMNSNLSEEEKELLSAGFNAHLRMSVMSYKKSGGRGILYLANEILGMIWEVEENKRRVSEGKSEKSFSGISNKYKFAYTSGKSKIQHFRFENDIQRIYFAYIVLIGKELLQIRPFDAESRERARERVEELFGRWEEAIREIRENIHQLGIHEGLEVSA